MLKLREYNAQNTARASFAKLLLPLLTTAYFAFCQPVFSQNDKPKSQHGLSVPAEELWPTRVQAKFGDDCKSARKYTKLGRKLVRKAARELRSHDIVGSGPGTTKEIQGKFIRGVAGFMIEKNMVPEPDSLDFGERMRHGIYPCLDASIFAHDVARKVKIPCTIVFFRSHALLETDSLIFESGLRDTTYAGSDRIIRSCIKNGYSCVIPIGRFRHIYGALHHWTGSSRNDVLSVSITEVASDTAQAHWKDAKMGKVIEYCNRAISLCRNNLDAYLLRGTAGVRMFDYGASAYLDTVVRLAPNFAEGYAWRAAAKGCNPAVEPKEALKDLIAAVALEPSRSAEFKTWLAGSFYYRVVTNGMEPKKGLALLDMVILFNPKLPDAYYLRAMYRLTEKSFSGAREDLKKAMELVPEKAEQYKQAFEKFLEKK
jgi:tetratricopeptide (TPR) repeat protein